MGVTNLWLTGFAVCIDVGLKFEPALNPQATDTAISFGGPTYS